MRFSIDLWREDNVLALATGTTHDDARTIVMPAKGTVVLRIPDLPLLAGLFRISVRIEDADTVEEYLHLDKAFPFRVVSSSPYNVGVAKLGHEWRLPVQSRKKTPADSLSPSA
jgi:hypothetical protein